MAVSFDGGIQGTTTDYKFNVFGQGGPDTADETELFSFAIRDAGPRAEMLLNTGGLGTSLTGITAISHDGRQTEIAVDPVERLAVVVGAAQARWCNPFQGCRFEFWRRRNGVEQSFTFATPVPVTVEGQTTTALKILFHSASAAVTPAFSTVELTASGDGTARLRTQSRTMPDIVSDGLLHRMQPGTSAHVDDGVLDVRPLKPAAPLDFAITAPVRISAWEARGALALAEDVPASGKFRIEAQSRLPDSSLVPLSVLEGELSQDADGRSLTLTAAFLSERFRFVGLTGGEIATDLRDLAPGVTVSIADFNCDIVPEFFEGCSSFTFRTLPQQGEACAWTVQLAASLSVQIDTGDDVEEVRLDTLVFVEQEGDEAGSWAEVPLSFTTMRFRTSGIDRLALFDQVVRPAH